MRIDITSLLAIDWAPNPDEGDKMLFVFDGGLLNPDQLAAIKLADGEVGEWTFVDERQLDQITIPRLARRVREALQARKSTRTVHLPLISAEADTRDLPASDRVPRGR